MHIGIYIDYMNPTSGGGFTFQESLLHQLNTAATHHRFTIFYYGQLPAEIQKINMGKVLINRTYKELVIKHKLSYFFRSVRSKLTRSGKAITKLSAFELSAQKEKIEFMWFASQFYMPIGGIPFLFTVWDLQHRLQPWFPELSESAVWGQREKMFSEAIRKASYILTGTQAGKNEIIKFYDVPEEKIKNHFLHPTPAYALQCDQVYPLPADVHAPYIFYPGQFWAHKNHICILMALKGLRDKENIKINAVFTGHDYGNRKYIEKQIAELGLRDQVKIFGFVERKTLISLYQHSLAVVYPSFFGPENLPPLEAMALGTPVIAAKVSGADEQLGDNVLYFDPLNEAELADQILTVYKNESIRNQLIEKGRVRSRQYTIEHYINDILKLFDGFEKIRRCWEL
jgi:glycosyltransferase involved in cell wall biosynthesis